jgi:hypothetical protein
MYLMGKEGHTSWTRDLKIMRWFPLEISGRKLDWLFYEMLKEVNS